MIRNRKKVEVIFLGTNGWYDSKTGNTISILLKYPRYNIVLDAGNGISKLEQYVNEKNPTFLFISHFHLDHIFGLHSLVMNKFTKGLTVLCRKGGRKILDEFVNEPFTIPFKKMPYTTKILEVPAKNYELPFKATFLPLVHPDPTLGVRLEIDGTVITFCPDTGYCANAVTLAKDADLVIAECAERRETEDPQWPHLNPEAGARIAREAGAHQLVLTHFDAKAYPDLRSRREAEKRARKIFPRTKASVDGMIVKV